MMTKTDEHMIKTIIDIRYDCELLNEYLHNDLHAAAYDRVAAILIGLNQLEREIINRKDD